MWLSPFRYGRFRAAFAANLMGAFSTVAGTFSPNFLVYCITRFFTAIGKQRNSRANLYPRSGAMGTFLAAYVLAVELVTEKSKTFVGIAFQMPFALGECFITLIAMAFDNWRLFHVHKCSETGFVLLLSLQIGASILPFFTLLSFMLISESPRWLAAKGLKAEYNKKMDQIAKTNQV